MDARNDQVHILGEAVEEALVDIVLVLDADDDLGADQAGQGMGHALVQVDAVELGRVGALAPRVDATAAANLTLVTLCMFLRVLVRLITVVGAAATANATLTATVTTAMTARA